MDKAVCAYLLMAFGGSTHGGMHPSACYPFFNHVAGYVHTCTCTVVCILPFGPPNFFSFLSIPAFDIRQGRLLDFGNSKWGGITRPIEFLRSQSTFNPNNQTIYLHYSKPCTYIVALKGGNLFRPNFFLYSHSGTRYKCRPEDCRILVTNWLQSPGPDMFLRHIYPRTTVHSTVRAVQ